ncbi:RHS repeat-associated core domain-containing protein [Winslowiella iniecta]|nr:RHS repeat-associated core domain-containing protein [Winslowiella iniecta]
MNDNLLGFNRQRHDPISAVYHPGNGYRAYDPQLMRFRCPDSFSPFAAGGINSYGYCAGDPINRADPSGHFSWQAGLGIGMSVLGIFAALWTGGASLAVTSSLSAALDSAGVIPLLTGAASLLADTSGLGSTLVHNSHLSSALGWISFAAGVISLGAGITPLLSEATDALRQRLGTIRRIGLSGGAKAAGREMASERQILSTEQRMAIINDPVIMTHHIDEDNPHLMSSGGNIDYPVTEFEVEYHPDRWTIRDIFRVKTERFFGSDLLAYQYRRIGQQQGFYGILPDEIRQLNVRNPLTLRLTEGKTGEELRQIFLTQTPNGKLLQRLGDRLKFTVSRVEIQQADYISWIDNGL